MNIKFIFYSQNHFYFYHVLNMTLDVSYSRSHANSTDIIGAYTNLWFSGAILRPICNNIYAKGASSKNHFDFLHQ